MISTLLAFLVLLIVSTVARTAICGSTTSLRRIRSYTLSALPGSFQDEAGDLVGMGNQREMA